MKKLGKLMTSLLGWIGAVFLLLSGVGVIVFLYGFGVGLVKN